MEDVNAGRVETVVCWRLDRLGKSCSELLRLFEHLAARRVNFISLQDYLDLSTVWGRRMAGMLSSITLYETEVRRNASWPGRRPPGRAASGGAGRKRAGGSRSRPNWRRRSSA